MRDSGFREKSGRAGGHRVLLLALTLALAAPAAGAGMLDPDPLAATPCGRAADYYRRNPATRQTAGRLLECFRAINQVEEAAAVFRKAAEARGGPAAAWKYAAEAYAEAGLLAEAEQAYLRFLKSDPRDVSALLELGRIYGELKRYDEARVQYNRVLALRREYVPALTGLARIDSWQRRWDESLALYNRALAAKPDDFDATAGKAYLLLWMGRAEDAAPLFEKLAERSPENRSVASGLEQARQSVERRRLTAALESGQTAPLEAQYRGRLAANPDDLFAVKALADLTADRCAETVSFRRRAVELSRSDPTLKRDLAGSLGECGQFDEAIALYDELIRVQPSDGLYDSMGRALRRSGRVEQAAAAFREALRLNPGNTDARVGLALALASLRNYPEALTRYDEALAASPNHYEALQGKAHVLLWTNQYPAARSLFERLRGMKPEDAQNQRALEQIASAEEAAYWASLRPDPKAPPEQWAQYYAKRLEAYPTDLSAKKGLAYNHGRLKNYAAAIALYREVLAADPTDKGAKLELARLLSWDDQREASIQLYQEVLQTAPDDTEALENLARVYIWSSRPDDALEIYQRLLGKEPANTEYQLAVARLQLSRRDSPAAREFLTAVLTADPNNREAILLLGRLSASQGQYDQAIAYYDRVLKQDSQDGDALLGKARALYFKGDRSEAYAAASAAVKRNPDNVDALFLLASLERSRRNRTVALALLEETLQRSPNHSEAQAMKRSIIDSGRVTLRTSASFTREVGRDEGALSQDLRVFSYGATLGFEALPRTDSFFSVHALPSNIPFGGLRGAVGPSVFSYRQRTQISSRLALRAGVGLVRFGTGDLVNVPRSDEQAPSARFSPLYSAGLEVMPNRATRLSLSFGRSAITYTPTSVRLGVIEHDLSAGASFALTPKTRLSLGYDYSRYSSREYDHVRFVSGARLVNRVADQDRRHTGSLDFTRTIVRTERVGFDTGYEASIYGHSGDGLFLGFFNPGFYQSHRWASDFWAVLAGPLRFNLQGGVGVRDREDDELRRTLRLRPSFTVRVSPRMSFSFGYSYYNTAETLGDLTGNGVFLSTDWRF